jgi:hypothetical protein
MQEPTSSSEALHQISMRLPWPRAAKIASVVCQGTSWQQTHKSSSDWLTDAASRTPYSINTFRRQLRVVEFLESNLPGDQIEPSLDKDLPFGPLEVLMRLHVVAPEKAKSLFQEVLARQISYQKMLATYRQAKSSPEVSLQGRRAFAARGQKFDAIAIEFIQRNPHKLIDAADEPGEFRGNLRGFAYGSADLIMVGSDFIDGFEVKLFGNDDTKYVLIRTLEQLSLMSTFYRRTWLIYPATNPDQTSHRDFIESLKSHLGVLGLSSVGIAQISEDENPSLTICHTPISQQAPRQHLLRRFLGV